VAPETALPKLSPIEQAQTPGASIPLYPQTPDDAIALRMAPEIDPMNLGLGLGLNGSPDINMDSEASW